MENEKLTYEELILLLQYRQLSDGQKRQAEQMIERLAISPPTEFPTDIPTDQVK